MILDSIRTPGAVISLPKGFWIARALSFTAGMSLQLVGLYGTVVTFGAWLTLGLYVAGALAVAFQLVLSRSPSCSPGD